MGHEAKTLVKNDGQVFLTPTRMKKADGTFAMDGAKSKANWEVNPLLTERRGAEDGMDVSLDDWESVS